MSDALKAFRAQARRKSQLPPSPAEKAQRAAAAATAAAAAAAAKVEEQAREGRRKAELKALEGSLRLGDRVQGADDGAFGTVRYVGPVVDPAKPPPPPPGKEPATWVGVEWDDGARGTGDGTKFGRRFFAAPAEGCSSSFVRTKKLRPPRSFAQALADWQAEQAGGGALLGGSAGRSLGRSAVLVLANRQIATAGLDSGGGGAGDGGGGSAATAAAPPPRPPCLRLTLTHLRELNLSQNLLSGWGELTVMLRAAPALAFLNASSNRLGRDLRAEAAASLASVPCARTLSTLVLNDCALDWRCVRALAACFPRLAEASLCGNALGEVALVPPPPPPPREDEEEEEAKEEEGGGAGLCAQLETLHLSRNGMTQWGPVLAQLGPLPQLKMLVLSDNPQLAGMAGAAAALDGATTAAATAAAGEGERGAAVAAAAAATAAAVPRPFAFGALRSLYLTRTGVRSWADVDAIGRLPALRDIRIAEVPVLLRVPGAEGGTVDAGARSGCCSTGCPNTTARERVHRALLVARLPNVSRIDGGRAGAVNSRRCQTIGAETCGLLNRSAIDDHDRRDSEKFLVTHMERHCTEVERAADARYQELKQGLLDANIIEASGSGDWMPESSSAHRGWHRVVDEASGEAFYRNEGTAETRWDLPPELSELLVEDPVQ